MKIKKEYVKVIWKSGDISYFVRSPNNGYWYDFLGISKSQVDNTKTIEKNPIRVWGNIDSDLQTLIYLTKCIKTQSIIAGTDKLSGAHFYYLGNIDAYRRDFFCETLKE